MTTEFAITSIDVDLPSLGHRRLPFSDASGATSRSTILVGRNGTGKSTILRELAMAFRAYFAVEKQGGRQGRDRVESISIRYNSDHATLNLKSSAQDFRIERDDVTERGLRPRRLIALSFTPFDKFPPTDDTYQRDGAVSVDPFYVYLGFKNDYRSLSPRGRLLRSIDQLAFSQSTPQADQRVVEAFAAIGYDPIIKITYHLNVSRLRQLQEIDEARLAMIVSQIETFARETGGKRRELSYSIDFRYGRRDLSLPIGFDEIHELAKAGILRLTAVTLDRLEGEAVEMLELSSGELNLLSGFLGLAAFLEDGCLILIDEPENSLHPEWQQRYVTMLEAVLRQHEGCHYVIATHSPLIVSGVADRNAKVLRLDQDPVELDSRVVADMSPDANLAIACKQCNIAKSEHDVLRPQPRPNPRIETVPAESPRYSVPHPWVDDWNAFLRHVNFQIYVSETDKGLELINLCKLNKTAVDDGGLSYDSVVAAIRNGFFDIIENSIEPSPPDTEVLKRVARMTDTQHDLQADARLVALGKTLKTQERKAGRRTPDQAVAEAAQLLRENERRLRQTRDRDITNFLKDAPVKRGPPALPPPKLALPPPSDPEVNE